MSHREHRKDRAARVGALFVAFAVFGCSGETESTAEPARPAEPAYCDAKPIFEGSCGYGTTCHKADDDEPDKLILGYVDLVSPGVEQRLIDMPPNFSTVDLNKDQCPTVDPPLLVDSRDPEQSLLLMTLEDRQPCGRKMPYSSVPGFNDSSIACIRDWVHGIVAEAQGAQ